MSDLSDNARLLRLRAEWYRHGLHDVYNRGDGRLTAQELRQQVVAFQRHLLELTKDAR